MESAGAAVLQDKLLQKQHFRSAGVPVGDFCGVEDAAAVHSAVETFGAPLMLKARRCAAADRAPKQGTQKHPCILVSQAIQQSCMGQSRLC